MSGIWVKLRPHLLSWHMVPCPVMLAAAVGVAIATGQPSRILGAIACMVMMMVMMAAMGGHNHGGHDRSVLATPTTSTATPTVAEVKSEAVHRRPVSSGTGPSSGFEGRGGRA